MYFLRFLLLLQLTTILVLGQTTHQSKPPILSKQPEALVRSLYYQVVYRHPSDIPTGADMKIFAPYLSKALHHKIDLSFACSADWNRQYPPNPILILKPPYCCLEFGIFSGGNERERPRTFHIERTQSEKDGSFLVTVRLTLGLQSEGTEIWHVAAIVVREDGHFVIDDIIYLKDEPTDEEWRLSKALSEGCDGPRWVGYGADGRVHAFKPIWIVHP